MRRLVYSLAERTWGAPQESGRWSQGVGGLNSNVVGGSAEGQASVGGPNRQAEVIAAGIRSTPADLVVVTTGAHLMAGGGGGPFPW